MIAKRHAIPVIRSNIIYQAIEQFVVQIETLLPPREEVVVLGEGEVTEVFDIHLKKTVQSVAGVKYVRIACACAVAVACGDSHDGGGCDVELPRARYRARTVCV